MFRRDTRQRLEYRGPMPGLAPEGPADLICEKFHILGHSSLPCLKVGLTCRFAASGLSIVRSSLLRSRRSSVAAVILIQAFPDCQLLSVGWRRAN